MASRQTSSRARTTLPQIPAVGTSSSIRSILTSRRHGPRIHSAGGRTASTGGSTTSTSAFSSQAKAILPFLTRTSSPWKSQPMSGQSTNKLKVRSARPQSRVGNCRSSIVLYYDTRGSQLALSYSVHILNTRVVHTFRACGSAYCGCVQLYHCSPVRTFI